MNGAHAIVRSLEASGIDTCFANPGTSEMHMVAALDTAPGIDCVLGLTESVVTGAADGYARMADKPAATLLHCGPGLANGIVNLHNARRARSPVVNLVGDQATYHSPLDPPLAFETENLARTVGWARLVRSPLHAAQDVAAAVAAARREDQVATVILPSDVCWSEGAQPAPCVPASARAEAGEAQIVAAAQALQEGEAALLLGGRALRGRALALAGEIARRTGARLMAPSANSRIERGPGRPVVHRLPYAGDLAQAALAEVRHLVLAGAPSPVSFFAYPGRPQTPLSDSTAVRALCGPLDDIESAFERLLERLPAAHGTGMASHSSLEPARAATGATSAASLAASLAALLPADAIVVDESVSLGRELYQRMAHAPAHDWLQLTGGAIGDGLPLSTGAALGAPGRQVVTLQADGSALYSVQALWTQARRGLHVTTIVLSNRKYATLYHEMRHVGALAGPTASKLFDLDEPAIGWCALANSFGVEAATVATMDVFNDIFRAACARRGPFLIELLV